MKNPFDDEAGTFYVLRNKESQYSLWPSFGEIPDGWSVCNGPGTRASCLEYVEQHWTDMRPSSLVEEMNRQEG